MRILSILVIVFAMSFLPSCSGLPGNENQIRLKGSETMRPLIEYLAAEYMREHPEISVYVEGGGTTEGIRAVTEGTVDICTASRTLAGSEVKDIAREYGTVGVTYIIAKDAVLLFGNPKNPVQSLTISQIKSIFSGTIKNWGELGGIDTIIVPVIRQPNSGTYSFFQLHVLDGEPYAADAVSQPTFEALIKTVQTMQNAIGYGGFKAPAGVKAFSINGIAPQKEAVQNDTYPLTRYLQFICSHEPKGEVKKFIDWVISDAGQKRIQEFGYIPLWK